MARAPDGGTEKEGDARELRRVLALGMVSEALLVVGILLVIQPGGIVRQESFSL